MKYNLLKRVSPDTATLFFWIMLGYPSIRFGGIYTAMVIGNFNGATERLPSSKYCMTLQVAFRNGKIDMNPCRDCP